MKRGIAFLVVATILWGGNYICGRYLATALPATLLNTIRWATSTVILVILLLLNKKRLPLLKQWKEFALLGFLGIFAFSTLNYIGLKSISATQAGMISAGIPIAILLFTVLVFRERVKGRAWTGAILSIIGVIILLKGKTSSNAPVSFYGELEILLAGLAWGLYTVMGKRFRSHTDTLTLTAGAAFYGSLFSALSCIGTVHLSSIHMTTTAWLCVLYVSTLASVVAYLAWNEGVSRIGAIRAAPYINLLPVWTVLLGLLILHESISRLSLVGGVVTIIGAVLATL